MTGLFSGAASVFDQYNLVGNQAAAEAVAVAQETAGKVPSPIPDMPAGVQVGPGFELGPGKAVGPDAPLPGGRPPSDVEPDVDDVGLMPTWAWWVIGIGGVAAIGTIGYVLISGRREDERETYYGGYEEAEFERNADKMRARVYKKMARRGRGPKGRKHKAYPRAGLGREIVAMRAEGFTVSEISKALGISRNMVKSYMAKERLTG
jgi:hypothetical protein